MRDQTDDIRRWHFIRRNTTTSVPGHIMVVDSETKSEPIASKPGARLLTLDLWRAKSARIEGAMPSRVHWHSGNDAADFWHCVRKQMTPSRPLWLFAHNAGFDLTVLQFWKELENDAFTFESEDSGQQTTTAKLAMRGWKGFAVIDDPPVILSVRMPGTARVLHIVDTFNYFRVSVKEMGTTLGIPKFALPVDTSDKVMLGKYCERDVDIVYAAVLSLLKFVTEHQLGRFKYTSPAQAYAAYRHRFMQERILVHGNKSSLVVEREAYFGGLCQCYFTGRVGSVDSESLSYFGRETEQLGYWRPAPVFVLDAKSFYPSIMRDLACPHKIIGTDVAPSNAQLAERMGQHYCIARVAIDSTVDAYPVRYKGRAFYARGRFVTALCGNELAYALSTGAIKSVGCLVYYDSAILFRDYVDYFFNLRDKYAREGNGMYQFLCKTYLNSLYGKFGQRSTRWEGTESTYAPFPWGTWVEAALGSDVPKVFRSLAWHVEEQVKGGESADSCPAICAAITSEGRWRMHEARKIAGAENVYYCDTDSLHVSQEGFERLSAGGMTGHSDLGKFDLVSRHDSAYYRGLKDYTLDNVHVIAGVRHSAAMLKRGIFTQDRFQGLRSICAGPIPPGVTVEEVQIDRTHWLHSGHVQCDGTIMEPLIEV